jgi:hypothetical protein
MFAETDIGARCDRHVGEVFAPRCGACEQLNLASVRPRIGYWPGSECLRHKNYPLPCDRCIRDAQD